MQPRPQVTRRQFNTVAALSLTAPAVITSGLAGRTAAQMLKYFSKPPVSLVESTAR